MARTTHSLGRDGQGLLVMLVEAGGVFLLSRQANKGGDGMLTIQLTAEQIRDMAAVACPAAKEPAPA